MQSYRSRASNSRNVLSIRRQGLCFCSTFPVENAYASNDGFSEHRNLVFGTHTISKDVFVLIEEVGPGKSREVEVGLLTSFLIYILSCWLL